MMSQISLRNLIVALVGLCAAGAPLRLDGQSIFRDLRDVAPLAPGEEPTDPELTEDGLPPGEMGVPAGEDGQVEDPGDGTGEGEPGEEGAEGEEMMAMPVAPILEIDSEEALNRQREEAANVSSPGVAALLRDAGQLEPLAPPSEERRVIRVDSDPLIPDRPTAQDGAGAAGGEDPLNDKLASELLTQPDARTFTFSIPAPRGQILDRNGYPLAQTKVVNYASIEFPQWGDEVEDARILKYAAQRIVHVNNILGTAWDLPPDTVREHYLNRRWMPLMFSGPLTKNESEKLNENAVDGLKLHPVYLRHYPNEMLLSHVIGFVGKRPPRSTGPIGSEEPLWGAAIGAQGLEVAYDEQLTGVPGRINVLYDGLGNKIREDTIAVPRPGHNVVTTIDIEMQRIAERLLEEKTKRGALVVMNVNNGDVVAMASHPRFNPNDFIPSISTERYQALLEDEGKPLFPRAFKGEYPPASTFKIVAALAFLDSGHIYTNDVFPCPSSWQVGNLTMRNWNDTGEGLMNVVSAIARSCNTWFYEVAVEAGGDSMSAMALRLGMGEKTGLPLPEEPGFIPTNSYWLKNYGYQLTDGDEANMSIGQGMMKATPLQMARTTAAIANRERVYQARLVQQIQDVNHNLIEVFQPEVRNSVGVRGSALAAVRQGMYNVVNASFGTGKAGYHEVTVAAKTGTGQWITQENRNIAWFAGYFPVNYPVYSFAVVYEGDPGETVSGGRSAAPILSDFLNEYLTPKNLAEVRRMSDEVRGDYRGSGRYYEEIDVTAAEDRSSIFRSSAGGASSSVPVTGEVPEEEVSRPAPSTARRDTLFDRLFNRRRSR